jgi:hypothetical protein
MRCDCDSCRKRVSLARREGWSAVAGLLIGTAVFVALLMWIASLPFGG